MKSRTFDFQLPPELIAQAPTARREEARLMALGRSDGSKRHLRFPDLDGLLRPGDLLVLNDTRVIPARIGLRKPTGGRIEALLLRRLGERRWEALLDAAKGLGPGSVLALEDGSSLRLEERTGGGSWILEFGTTPDLDRIGRTPLPPYIRRDAAPDDRERYQTVYAARDGAVAAPTAGLHFTRDHLDRLASAGVRIATVTLHVGLGTFRPVTADEIEDHRMEEEEFEIPEATAEALRTAGRVIAVGTTSCRTIETWARSGATSGRTGLFITPGFEFRRVNGLLTNFHVPRSTLIMLVAAFAGLEPVLAAYEEAVRERYRFYSYGDAMIVL